MSTAWVERSWCVVVPHHPRGARLARHRLANVLADIVSPAILSDLVAVLAELVGNAVRHAEPLPGGVVRVAWRLRSQQEGHQIRLQVTDGGALEPPQLRPLDEHAMSGRGLHIVAALASEWGVEVDGLGQSVWAEFVPPTQAQPEPNLVSTS